MGCLPTTTGCYPAINGSLLQNDLTYLFWYANYVTSGWFGPILCLAFFSIVFIGSLLYQQRMTGTIRPENSLLAASFVTFGFEVIMMQSNNFINGSVLATTIAMTILSFLWVALHDSESPGM